MTKTTFRIFFSFLLSFPNSFSPTAFLANLCTYEFFHFFDINTSKQQVSDLPCWFPFYWSMWGGTETKLEPMLDFNESTKTTEIGKPHTFSFISTWFDTGKNQLNRLKSGFLFPNKEKKKETLNQHEEPCFNYINLKNKFKLSILFTCPSPWFF